MMTCLRIEIAPPSGAAGGKMHWMRSPEGRAADRTGFSSLMTWLVAEATPVEICLIQPGVTSRLTTCSISFAPRRSMNNSPGLLIAISDTAASFK
ncbi:hypothetical protein X739_32095 [Mesorhizobium sp. LNHC220B00]|nr:hypothetical protein X739_32095 [Mesorhizobium sp. LNHC220B00]